jgi:cation:H+ antiporter
LLAWSGFIFLGAIIAVAGSRLSHYGDAISERTGLSGSWIGLVLMATVTSLPELASGVGSIRIANSPDLAVGDVLGSCAFNLLLLALVDAAYRPVCMFTRASRGHALSVGYGSLMLGLVGFGLLSNGPIAAGMTILVGAIYFLALRAIFTFERREMLEPQVATILRYPDLTLKRAVSGYLVAAAFVVGAGLFLPSAAAAIGQTQGWSDSFVGTLFLAAATSLPELAVTLAAIRIGSLDMAIANLLGSNLFNMLVLTLDDLIYEGDLLQAASAANLSTILAALAMNGIVVTGLIYRPKGRPAHLVSWASLALVAIYVMNAAAMLSAGD